MFKELPGATLMDPKAPLPVHRTVSAVVLLGVGFCLLTISVDSSINKKFKKISQRK